MGKSKAKRRRAPKPKPTGLPSVKDCESELIENGDGERNGACRTVTGLIEKLQSPIVEERECACTTLANFVTQDGVIPLLLQQNFIKTIGPLMVDPSIEVRHHAVGALRNLSVDGGSEICVQMVEQDIMTPLVALLQQYGVNWVPDKTSHLKKMNIKLDIFIQATHLLWNLCESSDIPVSIFNREQLLAIFLSCLQPDVYGYPLVVAVAQCLHTVTEDNPEASSSCSQSDCLSILQGLMAQPGDSAEHMLLRILATGILINISGGHLTGADGRTVSAIVTSVAGVMAVDAMQSLDPIVTMALECQNKHGIEDDSVYKQQGGPLTDMFEELNHLLNAQQVALEIAANLCCSDDDGEVWEDLDSSDNSSTDDASAEVHMEDDSADLFSPLCVPTEVHSAFTSNNIVTKVLRKAQSAESEKCQILNKFFHGRKVLKSLGRLQTHALLCLNNVVSAMDPESLGGLNNLHDIWSGLVQLATSHEAVQNLELLEAVTSAMRAVIEKMAQLKSQKISEISPSDLQFLFEMGQRSEDNHVRVNAVRILSTIGCYLATLSEPHPILKNAGLFLVEVACKDNDLRVVAEALDSIFDLYGEDYMDPIIQEISLVEKLSSLLPLLKAKIQTQKPTFGEHHGIILTARTNLIRFIKYKSKK